MAAQCAQESIYNLLPRLEEKPVKPPRYVGVTAPLADMVTDAGKAIRLMGNRY